MKFRIELKGKRLREWEMIVSVSVKAREEKN
jgi:hypothetical protein